MESLKQRTLHGLTWSGMSQVARLVMQFTVTAILARLLEPSDFGLLGIANLFIYLATLLNEQGFSSALIQYREADARHYNTVFWFNFAFGLLLLSLIYVTIPVIVVFFGHGELTLILQTLSLVIVLSSLTVVPRAILTRSMAFKSLAIIDTVSYLSGGAVGIYLALNHHGVMSLVYQTIVQTMVAAFLYLCFSKWRPHLSVSFVALRDLYRFGMHVTGTTLLNYVSRNVDNLLIGKFLGAEALGYYTLAFKLMMVPIRNIAWMVSQVMYPAFSQIQDDTKKLRHHYLITLKAVSLVSFPLLGLLFALAPEFVYAVPGANWEASIPVIRLLCIVGMVKVIMVSWSSILLSRGRSDLQFWLTLGGALTRILFLVAGLPWGIYGVSALYAVHHLLLLPVAGSKSLAAIELPLRNLFAVIIRAITLCVPMLLVVAGLKETLRMEPLPALLVFGTAGAVVYAVFLWYSENSFILGNLPKRAARQPGR